MTDLRRDGASPRPARTRLRVRYQEADPMGVAYYGAYLDWFTLGRSEWLREAGIPYRDRFELKGIFLPVTEVRCAYRRPLLCDEETVVETALAECTPARLRFAYRVGAAAAGETWHAVVDATRRPRDLRKLDPELWEALHRAYRDRL
jgi:acyl-CoA thioester hydrolase